MIQIVLPDFEIPDTVKKFQMNIKFIMEDAGEEVSYEVSMEGQEVDHA